MQSLIMGSNINRACSRCDSVSLVNASAAGNAAAVVRWTAVVTGALLSCCAGDTEAKRGIGVAIELQPGTQDAAYLQRVQQGLVEAAAAFKPDLLVRTSAHAPCGLPSLSKLFFILR
jgi:hypothetical protein